MKYDSMLVELKNLLPASKNILIALPANASIDQLAASLCLFLTLQTAGKQVSVVCDDTIKVEQAHLFGIDHVQKTMPSTEGGNLTLTLEGVASSDGSIPALEKLDWAAENNNLNLVFHVLPGQTFQPARIVPHYRGSGFNLIFTIGAANLTALGNVYSANSQVYSGTHIVNIDNQSSNTSFGQTNIVDQQTASLSEIMANLILDLGYVADADASSNLLAGIFEATANLTSANASAETYMVVGNCLKAGGRKPGSANVYAPQIETGSINQFSQPANINQAPQPQPVLTNANLGGNQPAFDWSALMPGLPASQRGEPADALPNAVPSQVNSQPTTDFTSPQIATNSVNNIQGGRPSPEELPSGEFVTSENVEPEWLTPKIFKGSSIG